MDIKRQKQTPRWKNHKGMLFVVVVITVGLLVGQNACSRQGHRVSADEVWFGTAERGNLTLAVQGFGKLKSKHQRLITAPSRGIVEKIRLDPGAEVKADDVILRLLNPDLDQLVNNQRLLLRSEQANLRQIKVNNQRELLAQRSQITQLQADYDVADFNLVATTKLAKDGIISELDHKRAQLETNQLQARLEIENQRLLQLQMVHRETINIQLEKISQQQSKLTAAQTKQGQLFIRANITGVLQKLDVTLGQSVTAGEVLAFVGGTDQLVAEIKVPQNQVEQVAVGQAATINMRQHNSRGTVTRIDPVVSNGTVLVDIALLGDTPVGARPDLTVDATIHAGEMENILFVERPVNVQPGTTSTLYKFDEQQQQAHPVNVTFGAETGKFIRIVHGASAGEQFILSDTSGWQQRGSITID